MGEAVAMMGVMVENVKQFFDFFEKFLDVFGVHRLRLVLEVVNDDEALQQGGVGLAAKGRGHRGNRRSVMQYIEYRMQGNRAFSENFPMGLLISLFHCRRKLDPLPPSLLPDFANRLCFNVLCK
jgi:hypothetical protein